MSATALRRLLIGEETVWGTPVVPAAKIMGVTDLSFGITQEHFQSAKMGQLSPSGMTAIVSESGEVSYTIDASYQMMHYPLQALDTPVITGSTPTWTYTYDVPYLTAGAFKSQTVMLDPADTTTEWQLSGGVATGIVISGTAGGIVTASQTLIGKQITETSATTLPAERVVSLIPTSAMKLYIDLEAGTIATTEITDSLVEFTLTVENGRHLKQFAGSQYPAAYGVNQWSGTLRLVLEANATTLNWVTAAIAGEVKRIIRLRAITSPMSFIADFAGFLTAPPLTLFGDRDGNSTVELVWQGAYNETLGRWLRFIVTNDLAVNP